MRPTLARTIVVSRLSGAVLFREKGARTFTPLAQARQLPVGSTIDATRGDVQLVTAADAGGKTQSGDFSGGAFDVLQRRSALTDLRLVGGRPQVAVCGATRARALAAPSSVSPRVLRLLRGHAHGSFRTVGRFSSAAVRGTQWETVDRCDGTLTVDRTGIVDTTTGTLAFSLKAGQSALGYCFPPSGTPQTRQFCIIEISQPADGLFGFGIGVRRADTAYDLCLRGPSGTTRCRHFPLSAPDAAGVRTSAVVCTQDEGRGRYVARWLLAGRVLGVPLPFTATRPRPALHPPCISQP